MKRRFLVTGGAGFIGAHIARKLLEQGNEVLVIDNISTGYMDNIPKGAEFVNLDIGDYQSFAKIPKKKFDAVFHLAAQSSGEISNEKPDLDITTNAIGTHNLLRWCVENKVKRFLYASSMAVYGNPKKLPVLEAENCEPLSFYGISKLTAEHYVKHYALEGLNTTIFRMFSVYGPGQNMENLKQGMASIFMAYLLKGQEIHVKGSKDRFRDFIYIDDVVDAWLSALDNKETFGKTYNLATGTKTRIHELVQAEIEAFGLKKDYPVRYEGSTPSDQFGLYADISNIQKDLHWAPRFKLDDGLKLMTEWAKKTKQGM
jgi:UDP-glucose 4-epimerase